MIACEIIIMSYITRKFLLKLFKKRDRPLSTMPSMRDCHSSHNLNISQNPTIPEAVPVPELPFDIITEILSWLPVQSLLRFRCVCKKWSSLMKDDYKFIAKHMDRANPLQLSYQRVREPNKHSTDLYDENFICLSAVDGLFLEESLTSRVFRIRNYATQQVLYLPDAHAATRTMSFVFNSSTGECKVACFYGKDEGDFEPEVGFKILSIGKDDQWRTLKLPNQNHKLLWSRDLFSASPDEGATHFLDIIRDGQDFKLEVQSFDLWSECFTITTMPRGVFLDVKKVTVMRWNQNVAVADIVEEALLVLVLKDFKEHKWSKIIVPLKFLKDDPVLKEEIRPFLAWSDELQFHNLQNKTTLVYDMKRGLIKGTHTKSTEKNYTFRKPSLVTLKGMKNEY